MPMGFLSHITLIMYFSALPTCLLSSAVAGYTVMTVPEAEGHQAIYCPNQDTESEQRN
jgi:hypothetical protein